MARTSTKTSAKAQTVDFSRAETMAIGSFMKRLHGAGMEEINLTNMGDIRRLYKCLSVMRSNAVKHLGNELSFEELAEENDKSFSYWAGTANTDFDSFA